MHAFGGLYIDLDVQCFRSAEPSLLGHDIVLQSEYREGRDIVNSIMASVPGHPFWKAVITEMLEASLLSQLDGILRKWELSCSISFTHQVPQGRGYSMLVQEYVAEAVGVESLGGDNSFSQPLWLLCHQVLMLCQRLCRSGTMRMGRLTRM